LLRRREAEAAALNIRSLQAAASGPETVTTRVDNGDLLRIVRDLRRVHSHIAALAYPVLERAAENEGRDAGAAPAATRALSE
jgi:phosphate:Na+ symporter